MANTTTDEKLKAEVENLRQRLAQAEAERGNIQEQYNQLAAQFEQIRNEAQKAADTSAVYRNALISLAKEIN